MSSPTSPSLLSLADQISSNAKILTEHLIKTKSPMPSLSKDGPAALTIGPQYAEVHAARDALIDSVNMIYALAMGPSEYIKYMTATNRSYVAIQGVLSHWNIPAKVPPNGCTFADIAASTGLSLDFVERILRLAMTSFIFCEPKEGFIAHTAVSMALRDDAEISMLGHYYSTQLPIAMNLVKAWEKWPNSGEPSEAAFNVAFNTKKNFYDWMGQETWRSEQFGKVMASVSNDRFAAERVAEGFDWASLGNATVVDVGGSSGKVAVAVARPFPNLQLIVEDLPELEKQSQVIIPEDLKGRVKFQAHSFWEPQIVKDADVYLFRHIFHNWSDKYCIKILENTIPALKAGAHVLIVDMVLELSGIPRYQESQLRGRDITMLTHFNAKERSEKNWIELLQNADSRLKFVGIKKLENCGDRFITASFEPGGQ